MNECFYYVTHTRKPCSTIVINRTVVEIVLEQHKGTRYLMHESKTEKGYPDPKQIDVELIIILLTN